MTLECVADTAGIRSVASAGNCGCLDGTPENPYITSASATGRDDVLALWASRGSYVDLWAPGIGILITASGGGYGAVSGTSFSSPIVAGVLGLLKAARPR